MFAATVEAELTTTASYSAPTRQIASQPVHNVVIPSISHVSSLQDKGSLFSDPPDLACSRTWTNTTEGSLVGLSLTALSAQIGYIVPWEYEIYCVGPEKNLQ